MTTGTDPTLGDTFLSDDGLTTLSITELTCEAIEKIGALIDAAAEGGAVKADDRLGCYAGVNRLAKLARKFNYEAALTKRVAETLVARRDVEGEIIKARVRDLDRDTPYWTDLMRRERDARVANDRAVAEYRAARMP